MPIGSGRPRSLTWCGPGAVLTVSMPAAACRTSSTAAVAATARWSTAATPPAAARRSSPSEAVTHARALSGIPARLAAAALIGAAAAGCGLGAGPSIGEVELTVTRDYGTEPVIERSTDSAHDSDSVMRLLDRNAKITTRYGGGFVQSIDGVEGGTPGGRVHDWFFYVNGVESSQGAADYTLHAGERVWWDYRDWGAAQRVPAVVGSFPEPFAHGFDGRFHPADVQCAAVPGSTCAAVRRRLRRAGADLRGT